MTFNWGLRFAGFPEFPLSAIFILSNMMSTFKLVVAFFLLSKWVLMSMCPGGTLRPIVRLSPRVAFTVTICSRILV